MAALVCFNINIFAVWSRYVLRITYGQLGNVGGEDNVHPSRNRGLRGRENLRKYVKNECVFKNIYLNRSISIVNFCLILYFRIFVSRE